MIKMEIAEKNISKREKGFSLFELIIATTVMLILLAAVSTLIARAIGTREREGRKTDALTSAHAALNVMSREIQNSGFGLTHNGIVTADSNASRLHFRANVENDDSITSQLGEDVTYYHDSATSSVVRYDPNDTPTTSAVINQVSSVQFEYFDYAGANSTPTQVTNPTSNTGRIRITVTVILEEVQGQPTAQTVEFTSDVTLRNSNYMLNQY